MVLCLTQETLTSPLVFVVVIFVLFFQQLCCLLKVNTILHYGLLISFLPLQRNFPLFIIIKLRLQNYSFECPCFQFFFLLRINMAYILLGLSLGRSFNHVLLTFVPFDQLFDQLKLHDCSPIHRFSMICFGDHHGRFVVKVLHHIFLIDNGQNCSNPIDILWFHFVNNPSFISVVRIWNLVSYVCQSYFNI